MRRYSKKKKTKESTRIEAKDYSKDFMLHRSYKFKIDLQKERKKKIKNGRRTT